MPLAQTYDTTIYKPELDAAVDAFVLPMSAYEQLSNRPVEIVGTLGLEVGVPVPGVAELPSVFFAALVGREYTFDPESFGRWASRMRPDDPRTRFAQQLVFDDLFPVETSPLNKVSLESLAVRGPSYVIGGAQLWADHPFHALGVVVVGEFGAIVVSVVRGFRQSAAIAAKYHTRRLFKVPEDWVPPEDRP